jgi:preprotein translocase subunit SecA
MLTVAAKKIFGTRNDRVLKSMSSLVIKVNDIERHYKAMSLDQLKALTPAFRERVDRGEPLDSILPEAFAAIREASVRILGMRHFDVQIVGGIVLHRGMIAEMKTGEGKTLVATLAAYLNALPRKGVHVVTVNDYLAKRDAEWMGRLYGFMGLSVGVVYAGMDEATKRTAYQADITYGQNNEFGFDYLRDNMKYSAEAMMQRGHAYAIVDEVDSILIDEARTPLIISGPAEESTDTYQSANKVIPSLKSGEHFEMDLRTKQPTLTELGVTRCEQLLGIDNLYSPDNIEILHHVTQALKAHTTMERDVDYVVNNGQVIIVDEFTGRLMPGRRWSNGLHQAVEAKEGLKVAQENQTLASITFQNLFRMYGKLAGMTGTADTEAVEFKQIYGLEVVAIPTNQPMIRKDLTDQVFRTRKEKYDAVVDDIRELNMTGQPILVGTISIEQSEALSRQLKAANITHNVLNAKQHEREAEIVAQAGRFGALTISTNMAGRGTDIVLGGNAEFLAAAEAGTRERNDPKFIEALEKYKASCLAERSKVLEAGGLMIMGTERHEARRIDNQLRGRSGRQGDPGCSRFYVSLEDDLMKRFGGDRLQGIMNRLGWEEGVAIDGGLISRSIESAQKKVEAFHFEARKHVTEYDDVMNKQRQVVYNLRAKVLKNDGVRDEILSMVGDLLEDTVTSSCEEKTKPVHWTLDVLLERFYFLFNIKYVLPDGIALDRQAIFDSLYGYAHKLYNERVESLEAKLTALEEFSSQPDNPIDIQISRSEDKPFNFNTVEQDAILESLDHFWNIHLQEMDYLREGIGLRGYAQKNPLHEYQREGFLLFKQMIEALNEAVVRKLYYYEVPEPQELLAHMRAEQERREALAKQMQAIHTSPADGSEPAPAPGSNGQAPPAPPKDPNEQRARLEAAKRERRRKSR